MTMLLGACAHDPPPYPGEDSETQATETEGTDTDGGACGNGIVEPGEKCDDRGESAVCDADCTDVVCGDLHVNVAAGEHCDRTELGGQTCASQGFDDGELGCSASCVLDTSGCITFVCGDEAKNGADECDGADLGGATCESLGFAWGVLSCNPACQFDDADCHELPSVPVLELSFSQVKHFDFDWAPALGAQYYRLRESSALGEPFVQLGGDIVEESISVTMPLHLRLQASYELLACNDVGCTPSMPVAVTVPLVDAVGYFKASNTGTDDSFGISVALSMDGSTLAVGARNEDDGAANAGAVYMFARDPMGQWAEQALLRSAMPEMNGHFGSSVALSADGDTLAVGADGEVLSGGAVHVFERDAMDQWGLDYVITPTVEDTGDRFGASVSLSVDGDTLAVGAYGEDSLIGTDPDDPSAPDAGAAYVFVRAGGNAWSQQAYVKSFNPGPNDRFGVSVALSGDGTTLAVGADGEASNAMGIDPDGANDSAAYAGAAYVFVRNGMNQWPQQVYLKASNTDASDRFGTDVAVSDDGNTLAVGARGEASNAMGIEGPQGDDSASGAGATYVFVRDGMDQWSQQAYVKASNTDGLDLFGFGVSLSADGNTLAVGAWGEASNAIGVGGPEDDDSAGSTGATYVFVRDGATWSQRAYVKASENDAGDTFGYGVALSGDGNTLAVGAISESSNATGIGGDQTNDLAPSAGAVYLY